jgi:hypothetical protein
MERTSPPGMLSYTRLSLAPMVELAFSYNTSSMKPQPRG